MPIRVASYNIRKSIGRDYRRDPARVLRVLDRIGADIIALQEADRRFGRRASSIPKDMLAANGFCAVELTARPDSIGWHGNAILLRRDMDILDQRILDLPGLEPRGAVSVDLSMNGKALRVVGVHLGLLKRNRRQQLTKIKDFLDRLTLLPTVILGDFNEWGRVGQNLTALQPKFDVLTPGRSFPSGRPLAGLDKIAISKEIKLLASGVQACDTAQIASDHLPIWADIEAV